MDAYLSVSDTGGCEMELRERIGEVSLRDAILLLAEHVQRHDELVAIQYENDTYAGGYLMPDDRLDQLDERRDELRQQIWRETAPRLEEGQGNEGYAAELDAANERVKELEEKLRYAESAMEMMRDAESFDRDAATQDQRRIKMLERRIDAKVDEINGLKRENAEGRRLVAAVVQREGALKERVRELEEELEMANTAYRAMHDGVVGRNDTVAAMDKRIRELEAQVRDLGEERGIAEDKCEVMEARLALRDADAEMGKAIRELPIKDGRLWVRFIYENCANPACRIVWCNRTHKRDATTAWHADYRDAIREYNEREDWPCSKN